MLVDLSLEEMRLLRNTLRTEIYDLEKNIEIYLPCKGSAQLDNAITDCQKRLDLANTPHDKLVDACIKLETPNVLK